MRCIGKFAPIFAVAVCYRELIVTAAGKELMFLVAMGGLSAGSLGVADFIASQSSERIGAARALAGMLFVSSLLLTVLMIATDRFSGLFVSKNVGSIVLACFHGTAMALALLLFFYALSIGKISVVAPIIAAHPVVIVLFLAVQGAYLPVTQLISVVTVLLGVAFVAASDSARYENGHKTKQYEKWHKVILVSAASSVIYGVAIILLQNAANGIEDLQILWFGRCVGFATVCALLLFKKKTPFPPSSKWCLLFILHGVLDSAGLLFILLGTNGSVNDAITAVIASTFPIVTVALAWLILKEKLGLLQIFGAALVFGGVSVMLTH